MGHDPWDYDSDVDDLDEDIDLAERAAPGTRAAIEAELDRRGLVRQLLSPRGDVSPDH